MTPLFPFGHGLSYSKFEYLWMKVSKDGVALKIKNAGKAKASEVVQFYLNVPETKNFNGGYRSPWVLKQFAKVKDMAPGEIRMVKMPLNERAFSYWDVKQAKWILERGEYHGVVGASSRDFRVRCGGFLETTSH